jgi:hypothetical protein
VQTASLEAERQENETIQRSLVEAQERNDVLCKKVRDSEYRAHQLQYTVQKLVSCLLFTFLIMQWLSTILTDHSIILSKTDVLAI